MDSHHNARLAQKGLLRLLVNHLKDDRGLAKLAADTGNSHG